MAKEIHLTVPQDIYLAIMAEANRDGCGIGTIINHLVYEALCARLDHPDRANDPNDPEAINTNLVKPTQAKIGRPRSPTSRHRITQEEINDLWSPGWRTEDE